MRPNKSRIIAYVVRTVASANEIDHFHRTVAIAVIFRKIHDGVCRFHHHLTKGTRILQSFRVSAADINLDRTDNIKLRNELTKGIVRKGKRPSVYRIGFNDGDETELTANGINELEELWRSLCPEFECEPDSVNYVERVGYEEED